MDIGIKCILYLICNNNKQINAKYSIFFYNSKCTSSRKLDTYVIKCGNKYEGENIAIKHCNDSIFFIYLFAVFICDKLTSTHNVDYFRVFSPLNFLFHCAFSLNYCEYSCFLLLIQRVRSFDVIGRLCYLNRCH